MKIQTPDNSLLIQILDNAFDETLKQVEREFESLNRLGGNFPFKALDLRNLASTHKTDEERGDFFIKNNIKENLKGTIIWSEKYKNEVFSSWRHSWRFFIEKDLRETFYSKIKPIAEYQSKEDFLSYIKKEIANQILLISTPEARYFSDSEYRKKQYPNLKSKYDFIWAISHDEIFTLNTLGKDESDYIKSSSVHYPFSDLCVRLWVKLDLEFYILNILKLLEKEITPRQHIKTEKGFLKCPFLEEPAVFIKNGEDILYTLLLESGAISLDNNNITLSKQFRGACNYIYSQLSAPRFNIFKIQNKKRFIEYLNNEEGYNTKIPNPQTSNIANESTTQNAKSLLKSTLLLYYPQINLD